MPSLAACGKQQRPCNNACCNFLPLGVQMITWSADLKDGYASASGKTLTALIDLSSKGVTGVLVSNTGHNMYAPGTAQLANGTLLVNGGANDRQTTLYDWTTNSWSRGPPMSIGRG